MRFRFDFWKKDFWRLRPDLWNNMSFIYGMCIILAVIFLSPKFLMEEVTGESVFAVIFWTCCGITFVRSGLRYS